MPRLFGCVICIAQVKQKGYAVVVVAEGAGENLLGATGLKDASG